MICCELGDQALGPDTKSAASASLASGQGRELIERQLHCAVPHLISCSWDIDDCYMPYLI